MPLDVAIVSPEAELWSGQADFVVARSEGGEIGILSGHAPFLGVLKHARLKVEAGDDVTFMAVHGGFIEVSGDKVSVLSRAADLASDIDAGTAQRELTEAEAAISVEDTEETQEALARAKARVQTLTDAGLLGSA